MTTDRLEAPLRLGLDADVVRSISAAKGEPDWMRDFRLNSLDLFHSKPLPTWGADLSQVAFDDICYYIRPADQKWNVWEDVPAGIRNTYEQLGVPEAERSFCAGLQAQYDSEVVYGHLLRELERQEIIFTDTDTALRNYPELVRRYFGTVVPPTDNKFAALNSAAWSGGAFVYMPAGSAVELPLHAYFHVHAERMGQFEHTLIVLEEGARLNYVEACTAPIYRNESLHSGVVEIVVGPHARCRFSSIQNWALHMDNLATKRAFAHEGALMEWIGGNLGSHVTMSYPSVYLVGPGARAEMLSLSFAGKGQHQDAGAKMIHAAPDTSSRVVSKSIATRGGRTTFRGLIQVPRGSRHAKSHVVCDSLILDAHSRCDTFPHIDVEERDCEVGHEASVSKIQDEQVFYARAHGLSEEEAREMIVSGFAEPLVKELPMCYARQLNQLIRAQMTGAVG
jgi:Fe-S cluster assembly protein SufB